MKKTIKIIDLYNMISKGSIPKKIKYNTKIYEYDKDQDDYSTFVISHYEYLLDDINITSQLNDEVEILDEEEFEYIQGLENKKEFYCYTEYEKYKNDIDKILYILKAINITEEKIDNLNNQINQLIKNQKKIIERLK